MLKNTLKHKINIYFFALLAILTIALFFRFYNIPFRYGLGDETVRDAVIGIQGARELQAPLIGAFSSAGPFTFGPWFYYQLIAASLIIPNNYASWVYLGITSVLYVIVIFKLGETLEGKSFGLILALLASLSPALIISATHLTTQNLTNIYAILAIWLFVSLANELPRSKAAEYPQRSSFASSSSEQGSRSSLSQNKSHAFWKSFIFGIVLGIGLNLHYQMASLFILPFILLVTYRKYKLFATTVFGIAITFLPLLFFELNNHWYTLRNFTFYLLHGKDAIYVPNRWLLYVGDFWPSFWADVLGVPTAVAWICIGAIVTLVIWLGAKKRLSKDLILLLVAFVILFILFRYYWGPRFFGYFNFLRPFVFLFTGYVLLYLFRVKPVFGWVAIIILTAMILPQSFARIAPDQFTKTMYDTVKIIESTYPQDTFTLYECWYESPYQAEVKSALFLLDMKGKLSANGRKLGFVDKKCRYPKDSSTSVASYSAVAKTSIIDFSHVAPSSLSEAKWTQSSFQEIYDASARWWFDEKP